MTSLVSWFPLLLRRRKRDALLAAARAWPVTEARLLKAVVVDKDPLTEGGTAFQEQQIEAQFFFTQEGHAGGSYFGGHLRSTAVSDSEGHRIIRTLGEDALVMVRYDPADPNRTCAFAEDNAGFAFTIWPS